MSKHLYRESLSKLNAELKALAPKNPRTREIVSDLQTHVMSILDHPSEAPFVTHHNLLNSLKENASHLEADHPSLTSALRNVIHTLSNMGI